MFRPGDCFRPGEPESLEQPGKRTQRCRQYDEALACFDRSIELNSGNPKAWYNRANTLVKIGKLQDAIAAFDKTLSLDPGDAKAWFNKGETYLRMEEYIDALPCFDRVLSVLPKSQKAIDARTVRWKECPPVGPAPPEEEPGTVVPAASPRNPWKEETEPFPEELLSPEFAR
jgi:tetratricopeptide (TPR) repeat protein